MPSVIRFFRASDKNENKEYKTAVIKDLENQEFKYYEISRVDVIKKQELKIHMDNRSKVICTSYDIEFNTDYILLIDGHDYHIRSLYEEIDEDNNNFFGIKPRKRTYLTIVRDQ